MSSVQEPDLVCDVTTRTESVSTASVTGRDSSSSETPSSVVISPMSIGEFYKESIQSGAYAQVNSLFEDTRSTDNTVDNNTSTSAAEIDKDSDQLQQDVNLKSSDELSPPTAGQSDAPPPDLVILPSGLRSAFQLEIKQVLQRRGVVNQPKVDSSNESRATGADQPNSDCSPDSLMSAILTEVASRQQSRDADMVAINESNEKSSVESSPAQSPESAGTSASTTDARSSRSVSATGSEAGTRTSVNHRNSGVTANGRSHGSDAKSESSSRTRVSADMSRPADSASCDSIVVRDWTVQHVAQWLERVELSHYSTLFTARGVNGATLLQLDSTKMKALGMSSSKDRDQLKKRLKDMRAAIERERKQQERDMKARERLARQVLYQKTSSSSSSSSPSGPVKKRKFFGK